MTSQSLDRFYVIGEFQRVGTGKNKKSYLKFPIASILA